MSIRAAREIAEQKNPSNRKLSEALSNALKAYDRKPRPVRARRPASSSHKTSWRPAPAPRPPTSPRDTSST